MLGILQEGWGKEKEDRIPACASRGRDRILDIRYIYPIILITRRKGDSKEMAKRDWKDLLRAFIWA